MQITLNSKKKLRDEISFVKKIERSNFPGQIFHTLEHKTNVYPGTAAINVKGDDVTNQAFYDSISNMPTTSDDYVFMYYDDHGGPGLLGTPIGHSILPDALHDCFETASNSHLFKNQSFNSKKKKYSLEQFKI